MKITVRFYIAFFAFVFMFLFQACDKDRLFEKNIELPLNGWEYDNSAEFEVEIADTLKKYNFYLNLRHTNDYAYSNLWVYMYTTYPSGKELKSRIDLPMAEKDGRWYGSGMGDIRSHSINIQQNAILPEVGVYSFKVEQNMRVNPLPGIMDIGLRVELVE